MKEDLESFGWVYTDLFRCNGEMMGEGFGPMDESTETSRESPEPSREKGPGVAGSRGKRLGVPKSGVGVVGVPGIPNPRALLRPESMLLLAFEKLSSRTDSS